MPKITLSPPTIIVALPASSVETLPETGQSSISGSVSTLEAGKATMMVGGDKATYETVHPLLLDIGPKATYVGPNGMAVSMKIALNLCIGVQLLAFSETILLAEKSGVDRKTAIDVFHSSVLASPMLQ